jgi:hypothetical protein
MPSIIFQKLCVKLDYNIFIWGIKLNSNLNLKLSNYVSINCSQLICCKAGVLKRGYKLLL